MAQETRFQAPTAATVTKLNAAGLTSGCVRKWRCFASIRRVRRKHTEQRGTVEKFLETFHRCDERLPAVSWLDVAALIISAPVETIC